MTNTDTDDGLKAWAESESYEQNVKPDFQVQVVPPPAGQPDDGPAVEGSRENLWAMADEYAKQRIAHGDDAGRVETRYSPAGDTTYKDAKEAARDLTYSRKLSAGEAALHATGDYREAVKAAQAIDQVEPTIKIDTRYDREKTFSSPREAAQASHEDRLAALKEARDRELSSLQRVDYVERPNLFNGSGEAAEAFRAEYPQFFQEGLKPEDYMRLRLEIADNNPQAYDRFQKIEAEYLKHLDTEQRDRQVGADVRQAFETPQASQQQPDAQAQAIQQWWQQASDQERALGQQLHNVWALFQSFNVRTPAQEQELQQRDPARYQAYCNTFAAYKDTKERLDGAVAQRELAARQQADAYQQQRAEWNAAQDEAATAVIAELKADAKTSSAFRQAATEYIRRTGLTDAQISQAYEHGAYRGNDGQLYQLDIRSAGAQKVIADAVRGEMARAGLSAKRVIPKAVAPVAIPGNRDLAASYARDGDIERLSRALDSETNPRRQARIAADLMAMRRANGMSY
jgi:hypothetical protein